MLNYTHIHSTLNIFALQLIMFYSYIYCIFLLLYVMFLCVCTYKCLVTDVFLLGVGNDSPLEQFSLVVRPILLDVTLAVLHMLTHLQIYLIRLLICYYLDIYIISWPTISP